MSARLWYSQFDVYDSIRRVGGLLLEWHQPIHLERLYILDFFFANAPLLHRVTMTADVRSSFRNLAIPKPDNVFLSYPASPLLFHQMENAQTSALRALAGKGLLDNDSFTEKSANLSELGSGLFEGIRNRTDNDQEIALARFLVNEYSASHENGMGSLRSSCGLRRSV
jgi:hypothetical protein